jgi:hypothetical protein
MMPDGTYSFSFCHWIIYWDSMEAGLRGFSCLSYSLCSEFKDADTPNPDNSGYEMTPCSREHVATPFTIKNQRTPARQFLQVPIVCIVRDVALEENYLMAASSERRTESAPQGGMSVPHEELTVNPKITSFTLEPVPSG